MRVVEINNQEIYSELVQKDELVKTGRELSEQIEKLEEERNKIGLEIQQIKDRVIPLIEEEVKAIEMDEYEEVGEVRVAGTEGYLEIEIFDQVEAYKEFLDEKKKEKEIVEEAKEDGNGEV